MDSRIYVVAYNAFRFSSAMAYPNYRIVKILPFFDDNPAQGEYFDAPNEPCVVDTWTVGEVCIRLGTDHPMLRVKVIDANPTTAVNYVSNIGPGQCVLVLDSITSDIPLDIEDQ